MAENDNNRKISEEENLKAKEAALAEYEKKIAEAKLKIAEANKSLTDLHNPVTEKDRAAAAAAIAQDNQKTLQAGRDKWKGPDVKGLDGKITAEGTFIESRILAIRTLSWAMDNLVEKIKTWGESLGESPSFIMYNAADFSAMELYTNMYDQLAGLRNLFTNALAETQKIVNDDPKAALVGGALDPLLVGYAAAGAIRTVADIVSLFRQNTAVTNFDLPVDDTTLIATFALKVGQIKDCKVYHPSVYPVNTVRPPATILSQFNAILAELRKLVDAISSGLVKIETQITGWQAKLSTATNDEEKNTLAVKIKSAGLVKEDVQRLLPLYTQLETVVATPDTVTGIAPRAIIMRGERMTLKLQEPAVYVIKLAVVSKGSNKISESIFRPTRLRHSAGTELSCLVFAPDGCIVFSGMQTTYSRYLDADEINAG